MRFIAATQAATLDALDQIPGRRKLAQEKWSEHPAESGALPAME
jgi:hypothetical protein